MPITTIVEFLYAHYIYNSSIGINMYIRYIYAFKSKYTMYVCMYIHVLYLIHSGIITNETST